MFTDPVILAVAQATWIQAFWSTLISGILGLGMGLILGQELRHRSSSRLPVLFAIPFGIPSIVAATAWVGWLGRAGIFARWGLSLDWIYSVKAVILAHVFLNAPWIALLVAQARRNVPDLQLEAARVLGASRWVELKWVIWPYLRWVLGSACAQVMTLCSMSFVLVLILGGGPPVQTLETELYARLRYGTLDLSGAVACAFWQLILTLVPWLFILWFRSRQKEKGRFPAKLHLTSSQNAAESSRFRNARFFGLKRLALGGLGCFFILPYFFVLDEKVIQILFSSATRTSIAEPLRLSFILAISCSGLTVVTAVAAMGFLRALKQWPWIEAIATLLLNLASGISILVLGLGAWLAYSSLFDFFAGNFWLILGLQTTLFFPIAFRILWPVAQLKAIDQREAAFTLGASWFYSFWHIDLPRWRGPLLAALSGIAGASLGEVGAVSLFYHERLIPLPLLISQWMNQYRFAEAQGVAGLLFLFSLLLILVSMELGGRVSGNVNSKGKEHENDTYA